MKESFKLLTLFILCYFLFQSSLALQVDFFNRFSFNFDVLNSNFFFVGNIFLIVTTFVLIQILVVTLVDDGLIGDTVRVGGTINWEEILA